MITLEQAINKINNTDYTSKTVIHYTDEFKDTVSGTIILWNGEDRVMELRFTSPRPYAESILKDF